MSARRRRLFRNGNYLALPADQAAPSKRLSYRRSTSIICQVPPKENIRENWGGLPTTHRASASQSRRFLSLSPSLGDLCQLGPQFKSRHSAACCEKARRFLMSRQLDRRGATCCSEVRRPHAMRARMHAALSSHNAKRTTSASAACRLGRLGSASAPLRARA